MNYIFLTNTNWSEPPRIRHQLAQLLKNNGDKVYFFEKPILKNFFHKNLPIIKDEIIILKNARVFHHRFSFGVLNKLDSLIMNRRIKEFLDKHHLKSTDTVIINFIYDFSVSLKESYKVYSFLNDDFESQTAFLGLNYKRKCILSNIKSSGRLITTSPLLTEKYVDVFCKNWILLPWVTASEKTCIGAVAQGLDYEGDSVIFYGFINSRLNFHLIEKMLSQLTHIKFEFCGQISSSVSRRVEYLTSKFKNVNFRGEMKFYEIDFKCFFCSITPYSGHVSDKSIYATNKLFRLAAAGLPSVNIGLPGLIEHPSVIKVNTYNEFVAAIVNVSNNISLYRDESLGLAVQNDEVRALSQWNNILDD